MSSRCPLCQTQFEPEEGAKHRPFCSPRCKKLDLLNWLNGAYTLPRELLPEELADLPQEEQDEIIARALGEDVSRPLH